MIAILGHFGVSMRLILGIFRVFTLGQILCHLDEAAGVAQVVTLWAKIGRITKVTGVANSIDIFCNFGAIFA